MVARERARPDEATFGVEQPADRVLRIALPEVEAVGQLAAVLLPERLLDARATLRLARDRRREARCW